MGAGIVGLIAAALAFAALAFVIYQAWTAWQDLRLLLEYRRHWRRGCFGR